MARFYVDTDARLARILGVTAPAVRKAAERGRIERTADGRWDVLGAVRSWRFYTSPALQRPSATLRPWLDPETPLTPGIISELVRRARAEGAAKADDGGRGGRRRRG